MLELCLVLPVLLMLTLGVIEFGRAACFDIEVADAARAGALYGAQSLADAIDQGGIRQAALNNEQDVDSANVTITPSFSCACPGSGTSGGCPQTGCSYPQVYVTVEVQYRLATLFQYPGIPDPIILTTISTMPVRQQ